MTARYRVFDPLLGDAGAEAMLRLCERFGRYPTYAEDVTAAEPFAPEIPQRYDAAANFVRTGGRFARPEDPRVLASRTNYFRATYAYDRPATPGIEPFLFHEGFVDAARELHGRPLVAPNIVYANLLVPGQELAVHTDVPEFRGANRTKDPEWLLVAMHLSGLFEAWRMPIATAVSWFRGCRGGAFAYYPDGRDGAPETISADHDTAALLDTDSIFHGVDRVAETPEPLPPIRPGMRLVHEGGERWSVRDGDAEVARYRWDDIRFSVSWKAYCFADEAERRAVAEHTDDLTRERILETLIGDLRRRGRLPADAPPPPPSRELALLLIEEYIRFPEPAAA